MNHSQNQAEARTRFENKYFCLQTGPLVFRSQREKDSNFKYSYIPLTHNMSSLEATHTVVYDARQPIWKQLVPLEPTFPPVKQGSKAFAFPSLGLMVSVQAGWDFKSSIISESGMSLRYPHWHNSRSRSFPMHGATSFEVVVLPLTGGLNSYTPEMIKEKCATAIVPERWRTVSIFGFTMMSMGEFIPTKEVEDLLVSMSV